MPTDPTLVAALRDATAAQLREDAALAVVRWQNAREDIARMGGNPSDNPTNHSELRLAALALAVARMQERGFGVDAAWFGPDDPPVWFDTNTRPDEHSDVTTLPAALSALLSDE